MDLLCPLENLKIIQIIFCNHYTDKFDDPNLPGEMQVTVTLKEVLGGTEVHIVQEGVPDVIPAEMCYQGWQESLIQLAQLVDPEIPDEG